MKKGRKGMTDRNKKVPKVVEIIDRGDFDITVWSDKSISIQIFTGIHIVDLTKDDMEKVSGIISEIDENPSPQTIK